MWSEDTYVEAVLQQRDVLSVTKWEAVSIWQLRTSLFEIKYSFTHERGVTKFWKLDRYLGHFHIYCKIREVPDEDNVYCTCNNVSQD